MSPWNTQAGEETSQGYVPSQGGDTEMSWEYPGREGGHRHTDRQAGRKIKLFSPPTLTSCL